MSKWIKSVIAAVVLTIGFAATIRHLFFLDYRDKPSEAELSRELKLVGNRAQATLTSPIVTLDKGIYLFAETTITYSTGKSTIVNFGKKMQENGWRMVPQNTVDLMRFCRNNIVVEIETPSQFELANKHFFLRATWGNADVLCR